MVTRQSLLLIVCVLGGIVSSAAPVWGQTTVRERAPLDARVETTIFTVPRSSTSAQVGGSVTFLCNQRFGVEAEVVQGQDMLTSTVSLIFAVPTGGRLTPFLAGGVGLENRDFVHAGSSPDSRTRFVTNLGGGLAVRIHDRIAIRGDARWINQGWRIGNGVTFRF